MDKLIMDLRQDLINKGDEKIKLSGERFFREKVQLYGIRTADVSATGRQYFKNIENKDKDQIFSLCTELFSAGIMEESFIACNWSYYLRNQYKSTDFKVFDTWIYNYVSNWATCDTLCNHTVGTFLEMYPEYLKALRQWAESENRWVRRASAVSLIVPARKGKFLKDIFDIADILHSDMDDMVRKGYGWLLKAASQSHQQEVFKYVMKKKDTMPRIALRYSIEKMPQEMRRKAMEK